MLVGDLLTGRFVPPRWRERLGARCGCCSPCRIWSSPCTRRCPLAVAAVALASVGYSARLLLQERLMALTPDELSGHALGLHSSGMLTMQGVGAALAGAVAQRTSPADGDGRDGGGLGRRHPGPGPRAAGRSGGAAPSGLVGGEVRGGGSGGTSTVRAPRAP